MTWLVLCCVDTTKIGKTLKLIIIIPTAHSANEMENRLTISPGGNERIEREKVFHAFSFEQRRATSNFHINLSDLYIIIARICNYFAILFNSISQAADVECGALSWENERDSKIEYEVKIAVTAHEWIWKLTKSCHRPLPLPHTMRVYWCVDARWGLFERTFNVYEH